MDISEMADRGRVGHAAVGTSSGVGRNRRILLPSPVQGLPRLLGVITRPSGQLRRSATTRASVSVTTLGSNGLATAMPNASAPTR
jgi:hypothetical protein